MWDDWRSGALGAVEELMNGLWVLSVVVHAYVALRLLPGVVASAGAPSAWVLGVVGFAAEPRGCAYVAPEMIHI